MRQRRCALVSHLAGPTVQEFFTTLPDIATDYEAVVTALNNYFVLNISFSKQASHQAKPELAKNFQKYLTHLQNLALTSFTVTILITTFKTYYYENLNLHISDID